MIFALLALMGLGIIDSYFISFLGTNQLAAIGFIVPIASIIQGFALGLGMAISSLTSKLIGANRTNSAARLISDGFILTLIVGAIAVVSLAFFHAPLFKLIGADSATMIYIMEYMSTWILSAPFIMAIMVASSTFRAIGDTATAAKIAMTMTVLNMILDPIFIFGLGPIPRLEMTGAALATLIAVIISTSIGIYQLSFKERLLLWTKPPMDKFKQNLSDLLNIAIPAILANSIVPITAAVLTALVAHFGTDAVAGFGVGMRIEGLSLIIIYALSSTLPMFIGQNLGANKLDRVYQASQIAFRFTVLFQVAIYLGLLMLANTIASLFSSEQSVQNIIVLFIWIIPISYGLSGIVILINVSMNVLGQPRRALYINLLRLFLLYMPLAYLGGQVYGLKGLFIGIAIGNCLAYLIASYFLKLTYRELDINY